MCACALKMAVNDAPLWALFLVIFALLAVLFL
jgi:hypothetical protein